VEKLLAFSADCNGRFVELDPFQGACFAVAEACRNLVCSGAEPIGLTDCLNFGDPERPEVMRQFSRAIDGLGAACRALGVPIVSGNVSLYNETEGRAILPTPTIAAVGLIDSRESLVTSWWKSSGDVIFLLGDAAPSDAGAGLAGSEYAAMKLASVDGTPAWPSGAPAPIIDLDLEARLQKLVLSLARERLLTSAHDVSDGGLLVALAECSSLAPGPHVPVGGRVDLEVRDASPLARASMLFGEHPSRIVVTVRRDDAARLASAATDAGVPVRELGVTGGDTLSVYVTIPHAKPGDTTVVVVPVEELRKARESALDGIVG
jgi:phosphoribosylformylglycinamidine synthase